MSPLPSRVKARVTLTLELDVPADAVNFYRDQPAGPAPSGYPKGYEYYAEIGDYETLGELVWYELQGLLEEHGEDINHPDQIGLYRIRDGGSFSEDLVKRFDMEVELP